VTEGWTFRSLGPAEDRAAVASLWQAAFELAWPLLPGAIAILSDGVLAVDSGRPVGFVAVDIAGSIPLLLVHPAHQRRGIGTALAGAALRRLGTAGVTQVAAGSGGTSSIWRGVPLDLPAAAGFFAACGWDARYDTLDLVADLRGYRPPAGAYDGAARSGVTIRPGTESDAGAVLAFETAVFPRWARWFHPSDQNVLIARDSAGSIAGTLLFSGPSAGTVFGPMLGPDPGTIGCVGVAPHQQERGIGTAMVTRASAVVASSQSIGGGRWGEQPDQNVSVAEYGSAHASRAHYRTPRRPLSCPLPARQLRGTGGCRDV
jgi:ribosomal protein S18 acetylase RimI-like enzyme